MTRQWEWATLKDVLAPQPNRKPLQQGWSPKCIPTPSPGSETWGVLKTTSIQPGWFDETQNKELPSTLKPRPAIEVRQGDLLMTCAGPRSRCGIPTLVRSTRPRLMMSGKMYRFRPTERLDPAFLEKWLLTPEAQARIDLMKTGISDSGLNLTQDRFLTLPVPVPSGYEQRRIVEIVEEHFSRLDSGDAALRMAQRRAQVQLTSVIDNAVWNSGGEIRAIGRILREPMRNGRSDRATKDGTGTRTLTLTAVTQRDFSDRYTKMTTTPPAAAQGLWLESGDVFVQRSNTPDLVGSSAIYEGPGGWAIFPDLLIRLRTDLTQVIPGYLDLALRAERTHRSIRSRAKGLSSSMPKIDQNTVATTEISVPDLQRQIEILRDVSEAETRLAGLTAALEHQSRRSAVLRRGILTAAFSGRLTGRSTDMELMEAVATTS